MHHSHIHREEEGVIEILACKLSHNSDVVTTHHVMVKGPQCYMDTMVSWDAMSWLRDTMSVSRDIMVSRGAVLWPWDTKLWSRDTYLLMRNNIIVMKFHDLAVRHLTTGMLHSGIVTKHRVMAKRHQVMITRQYVIHTHDTPCCIHEMLYIEWTQEASIVDLLFYFYQFFIVDYVFFVVKVIFNTSVS